MYGQFLCLGTDTNTVHHQPENYRRTMSWISPISTLEVFCHNISNFFPTMRQSKSSTAPRYRKTVSLLKAHPTLKLPSAMYLARFTEEECHDQISPTMTSERERGRAMAHYKRNTTINNWECVWKRERARERAKRFEIRDREKRENKREREREREQERTARITKMANIKWRWRWQRWGGFNGHGSDNSEN